MARPHRSKGEEEIDQAVNDWGYVMSAEDYMSSPQRRLLSAESRQIVRGRGRACVAPPAENSALEKMRLAAHINRLDASSAGRLRTTDETLAQSNPATEITATLRSLGIRGEDYDTTTFGRTTRRALVDNNRDIHLDGNIPVILNGDLFHQPSGSPFREHECQLRTEFDPKVPLSIHFPTIDEFYINNPFRTDHQPLSSESIPKNHQPLSSESIPEKKPPKEHSSKASSKKKPKWRKMTAEETMPLSGSHVSSGVPAGFRPTGGRELFGADGTKKLL
ncbi:uncharacterized protein LOC131209334 [Anopheles bellator]|uniref:uncharacterized protein LOC131209334 n=1 Tax=Anopheles bellator TaxID=139047 RepID=UPI0026487749|nr:uncharacterized protein LOC131209334 [Anopheles bellator]